MAFTDYTDPVPTPAPLASGSTIQSFTDPTGEVWVAKNGVNSGNWFKARDVLYARVTRTTALTLPTAAAPYPWNNIDRDVYGLYNTSTFQFTVPIAGLWRMDVQVCVTFTAAMQSVSLQSQANRSNTYAPGACNTYGRLHDTFLAGAGTALYANVNTNVALSIPAPNNVDQFCTLKYEGTG